MAGNNLFARVVDDVVTNVIIAEPEHLNTLVDDSSGDWVQTSKDIRKNIAGKGYTYDSVRNAFIAPKEYNSWILNEETCRWEAPTARPDDNKFHTWNEDTASWDEIS